MARPHSTARTFLALFLLGVMIAVFIPLGNWQLRRADLRKSIMHAIEAGQRQAPLPLDANTPANALQNWRPASASGKWLDQFTVLLQNRNYKGKSGYWVATPLLMSAQTNTAVLVLRGWLPFSFNGKPLNVPAAHGAAAVSGTLLDHVPRLFQLWSFSGKRTDVLPKTLPQPDGGIPKVQNLNLKTYSAVTGLTLLPAVLEQTSAADDTLVRDWPRPNINFSRNIGYAMEWFSFAAIAAIAWLVVAWRAWRRRKAPAEDPTR
jgi:cytochrome oxidase assembly protein ShyY1